MQQVLADYIAKWKPVIDAEIAGELARRKEEVAAIAPQMAQVVSAMEELAVGGKRLRALLTLVGYEMSGAKIDSEIVKAGVAMEIFHLALLIQDDVMDRDSLRRGVTTIHARYDDLHLGESLAILASDYCNGYVIEILASLGIDKERVIAATKVWGKYFQRVSYGQTLDVWTESRGEVSEGEIMQVLSLKSGEYSCVLPLLLGATLSGADTDLLAELEKYGMELGWVFHLRDDYLAEYGDSAKTGKPVGNDSREGKRTLVTMYGKERSEQVLREHWEKGKVLASNELQVALLEYMATREN